MPCSIVIDTEPTAISEATPKGSLPIRADLSQEDDVWHSNSDESENLSVGDERSPIED